MTLGAGGAALRKRIIGGAMGGAVMGICYTAISAILSNLSNLQPMNPADIFSSGVWRVFIFAILSTLGVLFTELIMPAPKD